jgi:glutamyl-tRNA synthetase
MRATPDAELLAELERSLPHLPGGEALRARLDDGLRAKLLAAMPGLKERAKTLVELLDGAAFLVADRPIAIEEKATKLLDADAKRRLAAVIPVIEACEPFDAAALELAVKRHAEAANVKLGLIAQPMRAALTGRTTSPGIFDVLAVVGREESLARLRDQAG